MSVSLTNVAIIVAALSLVLLASLAIIRLARVLRQRALRHHAAPMLVVPLSDPGDPQGDVLVESPGRRSDRQARSALRLEPSMEVFPAPDRESGESATDDAPQPEHRDDHPRSP